VLIGMNNENQHTGPAASGAGAQKTLTRRLYRDPVLEVSPVAYANSEACSDSLPPPQDLQNRSCLKRYRVPRAIPIADVDVIQKEGCAE
jgi:hypothetical protein